ncbi:hypothetical protein JHL21_09110 [Devosia sp. WQ 349]|uniref:hypothetical protein n=1 Tax=Devosia sp. WQ 349K1 TaxID=2800329 RepID=UPI0019045762|nr:hypothetical protein [Devosia sp. WQ 349K1]MBK1794662.1 hypothetical protein [Devosia sp. WQ 349K1]
MSRARNCLTSIAFLAASCGVASAELSSFIVHSDGTACWYRAYTEQHLRDHPQQNVTSLSFTLTYQEPDEFGLEEFVFRLDASLRDGRQGTAVGPCAVEGLELWCGVECDGGGIYVSAREGRRVLIDLARTGRIAMSYDCGSEDFESGFSLDAGLDDKQFLLSDLLPQFCMPAEY